MSGHKYDNQVHPDNVYGHTLELLERNLTPGHRGVHLDLACGFGHLAEKVQERFGLEYVGIDIDESELASLRERGHEVHAANLASEDLAETLHAVIADRKVVSITLLDGLEHMTDGAPVLAAISDIAAAHRALVVTSVPNVTHFDVVAKALLGRWEYTTAGLLDDTHFTLYSRASLEAAFEAVGLRAIDQHDVRMAKSDQHFPVDHVALSPTSTFGMWLRQVRELAEPAQDVNQFVWALTATQPSSRASAGLRRWAIHERHHAYTGRRPQELREALLCLAGQECTDFEVIVIAHKTTYDEQVVVERAIDDQPPSFKERIRLLLLDRGPRAAPLNAGLATARGRYVAIFDDDDIVFANWVEGFARLERSHSGRVLRTACVRQDAEVVDVRGLPGVRAISGFSSGEWDRPFSLVEHLFRNYSPPISWTFPRSVYRDFGMEFDLSMTTTEDWEFLVRAAQLCGVTDHPEKTAVYRWWRGRESSATLHSSVEWDQNRDEIYRRLDNAPLLLPAGEARIIRELLGRAGWSGHTVAADGDVAAERDTLRTELDALRSSRVWRWSKAIRAIGPALLRARGH